MRRVHMSLDVRRLNGRVCADVPAHDAKTKARIIDLDVDIGADAVDYKYAFLRVP